MTPSEELSRLRTLDSHRSSIGGPRTQTARVLADVTAERERQDEKWGGPAHDDAHTPGDFLCFIREHAVRAEQALRGEPVREHDDFREQMVRVAALAVATLEQWDRHWKPLLGKAESDRLVADVERRMAEVKEASADAG